MADTMKKNYKISGSGTLVIDGDEITILCGDAGEFNLAAVLSELDGRAVKFSFSYDEEYGIEADAETGEVI
jgi:hypothetical protein